MNLAVIHTIHDPAGWKKKALADEHHDPPGYNLRSLVEDDDRTRAVCLWEAPDEAGLHENLDRIFGHAVVNDVFPVQVNYFGLGRNDKRDLAGPPSLSRPRCSRALAAVWSGTVADGIRGRGRCP
jgi:hypothetical protein